MISWNSFWGEGLECALCSKELESYDPDLNRMEIDDCLSVSICSNCIDIFLKWQHKRFARLFPTGSTKRRYKKG